jgi:signal transduction histidine kinase
MNPNVLTAAISAGATMLTAIVALLLNSRGFTLLDKRIDDLRSDTIHRFDETNRRLDRIEADLKEFFKV